MKTNIYYLFSIFFMFLFLLIPTNPSLEIFWGIHMFANFGWTILLIIEHFKK